MYCFSGKYLICNFFVALHTKQSLLFFVVVYSKEITQKKTITNSPKRTRKRLHFEGNAHVVCILVKVKLATAQSAEKALNTC